MKTRLEIAFAVALSLAMIGCGSSSTEPVLPPLKIIAASIDESAGSIYRSVMVSVSEPASVAVSYTDGSGVPLHMVRDISGSASIPLPRLHANSIYTYRIEAVASGLRSDVLTGQFTTASLPSDLAAIPFTVTGNATNPLVMLQLRGSFKGVATVDDQGSVVWYYRSTGNPQGAGRRANGNWVFIDSGVGLVEVDWKGSVVHQLAMKSGLEMHHDVVASPQNTVYYLTREWRAFGAIDYLGEVIWEWDPDDSSEPIRRWAAFDVFDPSKDIGVRSRPSDWFHANSLRVGPRGNLIISFHYFDQINSIKPDFSGFEWRLGGPGSTFAVPAEARFSGQHTATENSTDDILLFDNGYIRDDGSEWSRAMELTLDPVTQAAAIKWQYRPSPSIWSWTISSARRLSNGNTVVTFGDPTKSQTIQVHEVDPLAVAVWKMNVGGDVASIFRGEPMDSIAGEF